MLAAAAATVGGFPLLAVLVLVSNEDEALQAGVGALEAGVVRLYGVVVLGGWVRGMRGRLLLVHSCLLKWLWSRPSEDGHPRGGHLVITGQYMLFYGHVKK